MTESRELVRPCSLDTEGKSQVETREKDFFFRRGGCDCRTSGRGGGGGSARSRRDGVCEPAEDGGVVNVADASVNDLFRSVF